MNEVIKLIAHINGEVLLGHFDVWQNADIVIFRQSLLLSGGVEPTGRQVEVLLSSALDACEAYYQAFQFVVWSGMDAQSAVSAVMFETVGGMNLSLSGPIVLIGAGNMGGAMALGWVKSGIAGRSIIAADPNPPEAMKTRLGEGGIQLASAAPAGVTAAVIFVAVKPQVMDKVLPSL